jgi:Siphovirus Gp157
MTNSLSLYQLSSHYIQALDFLTDPELNLPIEAVNDTLEGLSGELEDKAINVAKFIRNMETTANAIKKAEVEMAKRRKSLETRVQWLEDYLKSSMEATGITKIECPYFKLSIAKNPPALELFDSQAVPDQYKHIETVTTEQIDRAAIKAALNAGHEIQGARLVNGTRLVIK